MKEKKHSRQSSWPEGDFQIFRIYARICCFLLPGDGQVSKRKFSAVSFHARSNRTSTTYYGLSALGLLRFARFFFGLVVPDFNWVSFSFSLSCSRMVQFTQHTGKVLRLRTMNVYRCYRLGLDLSQKVNSFFSVSQHWAALVSTSFNLFSALSSLRFFNISVHKRGELWRMKNVNSLVVCSSEPQQTDDDGSVKMNAR